MLEGFEIAEHNQHGLKAGAPSGICPLCSHNRSPKNQKAKCASYNWERGLGNCHHCGESFQLHKLKRIEPVKVYKKPEPKGSGLDPKIVSYFANRGISESTLQKAGITTSPGWIHFNYYINGELINIKSRNGKKDFRLEAGCELVWYQYDALLTSSDIIICEGEPDALSYMECGFNNVVSVPNGAANFTFIDGSIDHFDNIEKVYLSMDNDEAGEKLKAELIRRLGAEKIFLIDLGSSKDANDFLIDNGPDALSKRVSEAIQLPIEHVLTVNDINDELEDFVNNGFKPGFQIGLDNFDSIFSTYTGQFITVTGIPSSGKSDFVDQMCIGYNLKYNWKIAYASPENKPTFLHVHKLIRKLWKGMPKRNEIGSAKWNKIVNHINDNFFFLEHDRYDLDAVLKKGAELVKRKGINCLVIDPFNKVNMAGKSKMDVNAYTMEYLQKIDEFCKKYDVLVIIVAHPTKMYKGADGKIEEPTMYNIKGGGEWYDASYHGILVHRDYEMKTVKAKVLKVKFQNLGENGAEAHFTWHPPSGCYVPHNPEGPAKQNELPW